MTVTYSGSVTSVYTEISAQEFSSSAGSSTAWGLDTAGGKANTSSTTLTYTTLTPSGSGELYYGYGAVANTGAAGSTSGFSFELTTDTDVVAYDTNVSAAVSPMASQSPAGLSGAVAVLITASAATPPAVTGVSPNVGSTTGGTSVVITGTNFTGASTVKFGTSSASSFTVGSSTSITATSPAESAGTVDITITVPVQGTSATGLADEFTYATTGGADKRERHTQRSVASHGVLDSPIVDGWDTHHVLHRGCVRGRDRGGCIGIGFNVYGAGPQAPHRPIPLRCSPRMRWGAVRDRAPRILSAPGALQLSPLRATGLSDQTVASFPTETRASRVPLLGHIWRHRSSAWHQHPTAAGIGWWGRTVACFPRATPDSPAQYPDRTLGFRRQYRE